MQIPPKNKNDKRKILFIGAHPDDIELGCGGTIIQDTENGHDIYIIIASKGERGLGTDLKECLEKKDEISMRVFVESNIKPENIFFLNIPDTKFTHHREKIFQAIETICADKQIDTIYTHTDKEYHQDHIVIHNESPRAARNTPNLFGYETNAHTYPAFCPVYFRNISDYLDKKINLVSAHRSQKNKRYCKPENIVALAKFRGNQSRIFQYAESFEIIRLTY